VKVEKRLEGLENKVSRLLAKRSAAGVETGRIEKLQAVIDGLGFSDSGQLQECIERGGYDPETVRALRVVQVLADRGVIEV
jgi:hypothetical protein